MEANISQCVFSLSLFLVCTISFTLSFFYTHVSIRFSFAYVGVFICCTHSNGFCVCVENSFWLQSADICFIVVQFGGEKNGKPAKRQCVGVCICFLNKVYYSLSLLAATHTKIRARSNRSAYSSRRCVWQDKALNYIF